MPETQTLLEVSTEDGDNLLKLKIASSDGSGPFVKMTADQAKSLAELILEGVNELNGLSPKYIIIPEKW